MAMIDDIVKIMDKRLCDHCLGRVYSQLLSNSTNEERGSFIRRFMAMMVDSNSIESSKINMNNFYGLTFRQKNIEKMKKEKCWLCNNLFDSLDSMAKKAEAKLGKIEFNDFLVGSKVPDSVLENEEKLWESIGIEYVESIKSEVNRELGKKVGAFFDKPSNFKTPEVVALADFINKRADLQINSLYILGYYQKLVRGIPQCKWGTPGKYKSSIQEIVAKPTMRLAKGTGNFFHGMGREDVDARCLGWRPFVIEIAEPKIRKINLKKMQREINKTRKVNVKGLKFCDRFTVVRLKSERGDKTYRVDVEFDNPVEKKDLVKIKSLIGAISQQTPTRVMHRRADLNRRRIVKEIRYKIINKKKIELIVKTNAGLYVKELVHGDNGRTKPSVSEVLGVKANPKNLDVVCVEGPKNI
jgi:tRNA pseudouridine synthase 10